VPRGLSWKSDLLETSMSHRYAAIHDLSYDPRNVAITPALGVSALSRVEVVFEEGRLLPQGPWSER
jgi:hypothetical protein